jgi:hypothetical protein
LGPYLNLCVRLMASSRSDATRVFDFSHAYIFVFTPLQTFQLGVRLDNLPARVKKKNQRCGREITCCLPCDREITVAQAAQLVKGQTRDVVGRSHAACRVIGRSQVHRLPSWLMATSGQRCVIEWSHLRPALCDRLVASQASAV